ncbi:Mitochondrial and peroxisomal fission factor Mff [Popillia japonica]|uniref:Mitochondrial and peroxisomal fission factor Mff n=1 Tax=Popillia japonica TaxID=7064 RepID=A0AAW1L5X2_POPJA
MKVPNKISFNNDSVNGINTNNWHENINMHVPERILVIGRDQHVGTRAPPREIVFDNSLLQQNEAYPSDPRIGTPPRSLTLDKYPFPGVEEFEELVTEEPPAVKSAKHIIPYKVEDVLKENRIINHESAVTIGPGGEGLTPVEEVIHLRRQMAKLNRRVMALELENLNRLQKEKILYGLGIAYFLLKTILWLNRNN